MSADTDKQQGSNRLAELLGKSESWGDAHVAQGPGQNHLSEALRSLALIANPPAPPIPPAIQDRWFKDQVIFIDGYVFERCRFDRCKLVTEFATFAFRQCFISPECQLLFNGAGLKLLKLAMHHLWMGKRLVNTPEDINVLPIENSDGTFTLE